ncbi:hypothetical protein GUJ93_ZPchr0008g13940 [Zizania palustris]|uniref:Uncharacterized protein n=1 Tax=Zizania palustris TaxID=103762 RepID=A0A8J5R109_ZIZPA|nr:hypothetical protein GUJ93_ZPchr0008g13940 [Zizania palustris]
MVYLCGGADYRHDKKFDAYTADDDWMQQLVHGKTTRVAEYDDDDPNPTPHDTHNWDAHVDDSSLLQRRTRADSGGAWSARFCSRMFGTGSVISRA